MDKSELIKALTDYDSRKEVVKVAIEDEKVRKLLFSLVEEQTDNKSLDIRMDDIVTISQDNKIFDESETLCNSMDAIFDIGEWDSQLIQPVIPSIISFLDYEYRAINENAVKVIFHALNKDNVELISRAIPKLLNLLDYREYLIEGEKTDNFKSVSYAESALSSISILRSKSLKDAVPVLIKYVDRDYPGMISVILKEISDENGELLSPIISDIIERIDKKEHILIIGNVAKIDVEIIKPAIKPLIKQLDNPKFQETSIYVLGKIAQKKVELVQPAIPKLIDLLDSGNEWVNFNTARTLKIISQQNETIVDDSTVEKLDDILDTVNLFDEITHLSPIHEHNYREYYNLALNSVNKNPDDPDALKAFGEVIIETYNNFEFDISQKSTFISYEKGIEYFKKSAEIKSSFETYFHIGQAYSLLWMLMPKSGEVPQQLIKNSLYYYTKASELNPEDMDCQLNIALKNEMLENHDEAISLLEESHRKAPDNSEVSGKLAAFYVGAAKRLNEEKKYYEAYNFLLKANNIEDSYPGTKEDIDQMIGDENLKSKLKSQLNNLNSKNKTLTKERSKKFSEAGELAYSECIENAPELSPDAKNKLDDILAIDTLISRTNQEMEKAKGGQKKSGFFGKLGDAVTSTAKQGKLKVELYNLERKKNSAITDFGEALWGSYKSGGDTFQELSDVWHAISDIEQQIHKNEEEIDNLNELLK